MLENPYTNALQSYSKTAVERKSNIAILNSNKSRHIMSLERSEYTATYSGIKKDLYKN